MNNNINDLHGSGCRPRDWATRIQVYGILLKKATSNQSGKWTKRFFIVKDGFLMYYDANEKKEFDRREFFNIHPKGILPLGECSFQPSREAQQPFCIQVDSTEIEGRLLLATESEYDRDRWMGILERSRRVTWKNQTLGDEMIRQLEDQGLRMAIEKQDYIDRLQSEVNALSEEKMRTEELEKVNQELEKEKEKLEMFTSEIQEEYDKIKIELEETGNLMKDIECDRVNLSQFLDQQRQQLETLDQDKRNILMELESATAERTSLSAEKASLSQRAEVLQEQLQGIEDKTRAIHEEKSNAEVKLRDNLERLDQLEFEKTMISEHASELQGTIQDLVSQKEMTEKELKEEIRARISAEERLKEAEQSLNSLDHAVQTQAHRIEDTAKEEMNFSVRKLKHFFEDLAEEAKISSDKPIVIRNGLMARKTLARRAKTVRYENRRRSSNNTMSCDLSVLRPRPAVRRAVTSVDRTTREQLQMSGLLSPVDEAAERFFVDGDGSGGGEGGGGQGDALPKPAPRSAEV